MVIILFVTFDLFKLESISKGSEGVRIQICSNISRKSDNV